ncbi:helicase [Rhodomicrobium udaipurense JA643]|uniref:Helicase n=1 Tax=Rhodomicrobium udaipurense TaxID=1202716 RepID=A0A8I1GIB8_9HYPH|nr:helicase-related protein [Rhodomicrobium udaipurense]KAI95060.1 helicase [Rhodomicrobium udaipurense JA643]MBJ7544250.1 helicase [Rhodomicrobium udaipurense]
MSASTQTASIKPSQSRHVTAVLGPTNTGKTHLAIERMLGHESGLIGLPLRLLAREVYDKIVAQIGPRDVALITGEEKIKPERPRYYVCTVEAMPRDVEVDFLAVDEIQLAADPDRGHVFTDRLFHSRGTSETLLLGAATMTDAIRELIPGANFIARPRLSKLTYSGQKKITRLQSRSAIVAFSANDVYAIAELIRRQRGGAAVVLGALSPRTRNAQVALYQNGDVDFIVATDAIGMGLNLDVDHVAFAGTRKFDGRNHRDLTPAEIAQIAGRAGRHLNDGTFGVTADVEPFDQDVVNKLENHDFEPAKLLQWRNTRLDFDSVDRLKDSLRQLPDHPRLTRVRTADDVEALDLAASDPRIAELASGIGSVKRLWDVCQIPDYRKVGPSQHGELVATLYKHIMTGEGHIPEDWFAQQVEQADRTDGDIDTLSNRIAHIRTWTFVSNRSEWLNDPEQWQGKTREIEDRLSDALHEQLTQRFVDKRTSVLMKSMRDKDSLFAEIEKDGRVVVEKHYVGKLEGFCFTPDLEATSGINGKAARNAAAKVLVHELAARADRLAAAPDTGFTLTREGRIVWENQEIGKLAASDDPLKPTFALNSDEHLAAIDKENIGKRVETWLQHYIEVRLKPLVEIAKAEEITGLARGIAFRLRENFGILKRDTVADEIKTLDQDGRAQLRKYGVRFGAHHIYFPLLLKPAAADLLLLFWLLKSGAEHNLTPGSIGDAPRQGLTSVPKTAEVPEAFYRAAGFQVCGPRAVRIDMLERLADIVRPLTTWKPTDTNAEPPAGAAGGGAFRIRPEMMSIMGCSAEELGAILESLGFRRERRPIKKAPAAEIAQTSTSVASPDEVATGTSSTVVTEAAAEAPVIETEGEIKPESAPQAFSQVEHEDAAPVEPAQEEAVEAAAAEAQDVAESNAAAPASVSAASEAASSEPAAADDAVPAEPEFEEVWRFRRPKPKFERGEGQGDRRSQHRRHGAAGQGDRGGQRQPGERGPRPRSDTAQQPAIAVGTDAPAAQTEGGAAAIGDRAPRRDFSRDRSGPRDQNRERGDRNRQPRSDGNRDRPQGARPGEAPRADNAERRASGGQPNRPQHQRSDRPNDRNRDSRPPRPQGRQQIAASAAPKRASGGVDPDSPFAALSKLKERLEKQTEDQTA